MELIPFVAQVREALDYDAKSGRLTWRVSRGSRAAAGSTAGSVSKQLGYVMVRFAGRLYYVHRLIWLHQTGDWPDQIDHIDRDRANNRWINLRNVSDAGNKQNLPMPRNNTSGVTGVYWHAQRGKWAASIHAFGRKHSLGLFDDLAAAAEARAVGKRAFHPYAVGG
jgi:hypothetical protein